MQSVVNRTNTLLLVLLVLMAAVIIAILANRASAGPLDPPGPPSSTMPQVEPRMPIPPVGWNGTFPITISQRGSYFLTENLTDSTATTNGILITASHVVLDLNGFTLAGSSTGFNGVGADSSLTDITVRNGTVTGWTGNAGIWLDSSSDTVEEVHAIGNGAGVEVGSGSAVSHVDAENNSGDGVGINDLTTPRVPIGSSDPLTPSRTGEIVATRLGGPLMTRRRCVVVSGVSRFSPHCFLGEAFGSWGGQAPTRLRLRSDAVLQTKVQTNTP